MLDETRKIKHSISEETDSLLGAKSSSIKLNSILKLYEERLRKDKLQTLKLVDRVEAKNQLKDKLIKEIEGFRTRPSDYQDLLRVDKIYIMAVVQSIKKQLNLN